MASILLHFIGNPRYRVIYTIKEGREVSSARYALRYLRNGFSCWNDATYARMHVGRCIRSRAWVRVCTHTDDDRTKTINYRQTLYTTASNAHSPKVAKTSDNESRHDSGSHSIAERQQSESRRNRWSENGSDSERCGNEVGCRSLRSANKNRRHFSYVYVPICSTHLFWLRPHFARFVQEFSNFT